MKTSFIKDFQAGDKLSNEQFAVKETRKGKTQDGRDYIDLILADKTGDIAGKIWDGDIPHCDACSSGDIVTLSGLISEFRDKMQLKITFLQRTTDYDLADFLSQSKKDQTALWQIVEQAIAEVKNKFLRKLLDSFFGNEEFAERFRKAPAAEKMHHAYLGGLMEHTVEMLNIRQTVATDFPELDHDLLIAGILLHDIGKMDELGVSHTIYRTTAGYLLSHITLGALTVDKAIATIKDFPEDLRLKVIHQMISHHGQLDFGSPVKPMTREAIALHYLDNLSAKMNSAEKAYSDNVGGEHDFSDFIYALDAKLYLK